MRKILIRLLIVCIFFLNFESFASQYYTKKEIYKEKKSKTLSLKHDYFNNIMISYYIIPFLDFENLKSFSLLNKYFSRQAREEMMKRKFIYNMDFPIKFHHEDTLFPHAWQWCFSSQGLSFLKEIPLGQYEKCRSIKINAQNKVPWKKVQNLFHEHMEHIYFSKGKFSRGDHDHLEKALKENSHLKSLTLKQDVCGNSLSSSFIQTLKGMKYFKSLSFFNTLGAFDIHELPPEFWLEMEEFSLQDFQLYQPMTRMFERFPFHHATTLKLTSLTLEGTGIGPEVIETMQDILCQATLLKYLHLIGCYWDDGEWARVVECLPHRIERLTLKDVFCDVELSDALEIKLPQLSCLRAFHFSTVNPDEEWEDEDGEFSSPLACVLSGMLCHNSLHDISFEPWKWSPSGEEALMNFFKNLPSNLERLEFCFNVHSKNTLSLPALIKKSQNEGKVFYDIFFDHAYKKKQARVTEIFKEELGVDLPSVKLSFRGDKPEKMLNPEIEHF